MIPTRSSDHATFVIERRFGASPARVFAAWSDPALKREWNACHDDWRLEAHELDFRVGGTEHNRVIEPDGTAHVMRAHFFDVVPNQRIVYAYEMLLEEVRISVSLVTVTFAAARAGTTMTFTEQVVFFDGHGAADERREGTEVGLDRLAALLAGA